MGFDPFPGHQTFFFSGNPVTLSHLRASRFDASRHCFEGPADLAEVCGRQLYPTHPSAAIGPVCVLSPTGALYLLTTGASVELQASAGWKWPTWTERLQAFAYDAWSAEERARCQVGLSAVKSPYPPYDADCRN